MTKSEHETLTLNFRNRDALPDINVSAKWRGTSAQFARVSASEPYAFAWCGDVHYIALHDIILEDGRMLVDDQEPVPGGDLRDLLTYLPPGCAAAGWTQPVKRQNSFTILYFDPALISEELEQRYRDTDQRSLIYFRNVQLANTLRKLQEILTSPYLDDALLAETASLVAAIEVRNALERGVARPRNTSGLSASQEKLVRDFIEQNLNRSFDLSELAGVAGLSRFHFSRAFKKSLGESPVRYVNGRRIDKARELLASEPIPVNEVASRLGFASISQFNRTFRDIAGVAPTTFRRRVS